MKHVPLLDELAIIMVLAVAVTVVLAKVKLPTVAGLLAAGALLGPFGIGLVHSVHAIEVLAEVGVVLLLFSIGLEFPLSRLRDLFKQVAAGGTLQVVLTTAATAAVALALGQPAGRAIFYGFVFALSSTAIVLRALAERGELDAPHGRFIVGTLIFQDLCVIPMVLIVPLLRADADLTDMPYALAVALGKAAAVVIGTMAVARFIVPTVLRWVDASRSREVFLLAILALCIGTAWLTSLAGLSLALGAFLGGMVVARTEFSHRAMGDILPLRDAFVSIFFVSLGMLFDVTVVTRHPLLVLGLLAGFAIAKAALAMLSALTVRFPSRAAWLAGVGLAQFGEFGFVLTRLAQTSGVIEEDATGPLLAAGIGSMFLTPLLVRVAPHIRAGERLLAPLERLLGARSTERADEGGPSFANHVVVVGYGLAGQFAARALVASGVPFIVLELNADNVRAGKSHGHPILYGDATSAETLRHAGASNARLLVLLMNDPQAALRVVDTAKRIAPSVPILMRTRYMRDRESLLGLGASEVVIEEAEGAVEMIGRMLSWTGMPAEAIDERLRAMRLATRIARPENGVNDSSDRVSGP